MFFVIEVVADIILLRQIDVVGIHLNHIKFCLRQQIIVNPILSIHQPITNIVYEDSWCAESDESNTFAIAFSN